MGPAPPDASGQRPCETPLGQVIRRMIRRFGPLPAEVFMALALRHPRYGYYRTGQPPGARGDFTTAPEISQLAGEMVGIWCVQQWEALGKPESWTLCEPGPGGGTMMADILRTLRAFPACFRGAHVHLVDLNPRLQVFRADAGIPVTWSDIWPRAHATPWRGPVVVVANEFLDALPLRQQVFSGGRWWTLAVGLDTPGEAWGLTRYPSPEPPPFWALPPEGHPVPEGWVAESVPEARQWLDAVEQTWQVCGGAGLWIDYGPEGPSGRSTWRGFWCHTRCDPWHRPGETDLTGDVSFAMLQYWAREKGVPVHTEAFRSFLDRHGIRLRLNRLVSACSSRTAALEIMHGAERLMGDMGAVFRVCTMGPLCPY
jgi:NADH dehydrogenase [ubiquinone] 1 alpha subcomplex assembly factor 7